MRLGATHRLLLAASVASVAVGISACGGEAGSEFEDP